MWLGVADHVATMERVRKNDPALSELKALLGVWRNDFKDKKVTASQVIRAANEFDEGEPVNGPLHDAVHTVATGHGGRIEARALGFWLGKNEGRVVNIADADEENDEPDPVFVTVKKAGFLHGQLRWQVFSVDQGELFPQGVG